MTNPNKAKGSKFELDVVRYLQEHGFPFVQRAYGAGRQDDRGDILGVPGFTIECKDHAKHDIPAWLGEAERERQNAGTRFGVVIVKRRGKGAAESYVVQTLASWVEGLEG